MKHSRLNAVLLASALGFALTAVAQDENNQPTMPPVENQPAAEEPVIIPIVPDTTDVTPDNGTMPDENSQSADDNAAPESFIKQGTTSPRFVAPMKGGTNAGTTFDTALKTTV